MLQAVSILCNYAKYQLDWPLGDNSATKVSKYGKQRAFPAWPDWMLSALDDAPDAVRIAGELIRGTGQRPSAAVSMKRSAFQGEWVVVTDEKGDTTFPIYCPERLRRLVDSLPTGYRHVLPRSEMHPLSYNAVEKAFSAWRTSLTTLAEENDDDPKRYSLHGLRKRACVELAEAGCSDAEIQAVTGQSLETVAQYRKEANRRKMSRNAQQRRAE
jgi:integrase